MSRPSNIPLRAINYDHTLVLAIELSNKSWVLAAQVPGLPQTGACTAKLRGSNPLSSPRKSARTAVVSRGLRCDRRRSTELPVTMGNAHTE
jgi:hypothetical protein